LCAELTRDLFAIAIFLVRFSANRKHNKNSTSFSSICNVIGLLHKIYATTIVSAVNEMTFEIIPTERC